MFLDAVDLAGTFAFALSGTGRGVERRLDLFGILVLAFAAAVSGGIARDVLIGATPPQAIADARYLGVAMAAGLLAFLVPGALDRLKTPVLVFDAIGLGLFAVSGTQKALDAGLPPVMAALLGMISAIGGGVVRDLLTMRVPLVLQREVYALAALAGALVVALAHYAALPAVPAALAGAVLAVSLRLVAVRRNWHLPRPARSDEAADQGPDSEA